MIVDFAASAASWPEPAVLSTKADLRALLEWEDGRHRALARCCRVSRQLNRVSTELLYGFCVLGRHEKVDRLLCTLTAQPDLARLVLTLDVCGRNRPGRRLCVSGIQHPGWHLSLPAEVEQLLSPGWQSPVMSLTKEADAKLALLIGILPHLKTLVLPVRTHDSALRSLFSSSASGQAGAGAAVQPGLRWPRLATVRIINDTRRGRRFRRPGPQCNALANTLLALPSIRDFWGCCFDWSCGQMPFSPTGMQSQVAFLRLVDAAIDAPALSNLFRCCPRLFSLGVQWAPAYSESCRLDWTEIGKVLRTQGRGLEELTLNPTSANDYIWDSDMGHLGSLRTLGKLVYLDIPVDLVASETRKAPTDSSDVVDLGEALPASLMDLRMDVTHTPDNDGSISRRLQDVLDDARLSLLRRIIIWGERQEGSNGMSQMTISSLGWDLRAEIWPEMDVLYLDRRSDSTLP